MWYCPVLGTAGTVTAISEPWEEGAWGQKQYAAMSGVKNEGNPLGFCLGWGRAGLINPEDTKHPIHDSVYVQKSHLPLFYYLCPTQTDMLNTLFCSNFLNKMICWKLAQPINLPTYNIISKTWETNNYYQNKWSISVYVCIECPGTRGDTEWCPQ